MLTRQLNSPDLDSFVGKAAFLLGLEVHHAPVDVVVGGAVAAEFGVFSQRGHECCGAVAEELQCVVCGVFEEVCEVCEEGPSFRGEERQPQQPQQPAHCSFCFISQARNKKGKRSSLQGHQIIVLFAATERLR